MITIEQLVAANKNNVEAFMGLSQKTFEGVEKLVELNLQTAKAAIGEAGEHTKALMAVKDAQELLALQAGALQPSAEKVAAYSRHLYDITSETQAEMARVAELQIQETQRKLMALVDTAVKNAPAGSENAVALMKSAVSAANNAFDSVQKAAKQAASVAEANFQAVAATATKAASAATSATKAPRRAATA
jgi:phasin family protein